MVKFELVKADYPILSRELIFTYEAVAYRAVHLKWGKNKEIAANVEVGNYILAEAQADTNCNGICDRCMGQLHAHNINSTNGRYHCNQCSKLLRAPLLPKL